MQRDAYAFSRLDGTDDFDSVEKQLEILEKPANPIFAKIRNRQPISLHEKATFATYVGYM